MSAKSVVTVDGKPVTLEKEIVDLGVEAVRAALSVDFPGVENAQIVIEPAKVSGGAPSVTVSKRAAPKQNLPTKTRHRYGALIASLLGAPEFVNPAIALAAVCQTAELRGDAEVFERAARRGDVERAIAEGEREAKAVHRALGALGHAKPTSSRTVPLGF